MDYANNHDILSLTTGKHVIISHNRKTGAGG